MADDAAADADNSAAPPPLDEPNESQESDHPVAALPPEFFMPLEQFDSVHHTLANLPDDGLDAGYLAAQTAQTQVVLDAINSQLSARVMRSYGAFVHGMAQVQQLESDLVLTAILCRSARRHLGKVQGGAVVGGLRLLWRLRRRRILQQLTTTLRTLAALSEGIGSLERLLKQPGPQAIASLPEAAKVLKGCEGRVAQLEGYKMARAIGPRIGKASDRLTSILMKVCGGCTVLLAWRLLLNSRRVPSLSLLSPLGVTSRLHPLRACHLRRRTHCGDPAEQDGRCRRRRPCLLCGGH